MLQLSQDSATPLYWQVYLQIRQAILTGDLRPGDKLPPSRQLAETYAIARVTVTQAYAQLHAEGLVITKRGAGTFVTTDLARLHEQRPFTPRFSDWGQKVTQLGRAKRPSPPKLEIDFGFGRSFPHIFPYDIWRKLLDRYLSTDDVMLSRYGSTAGFLPLRTALADYLQRMRGVHCTADQLVIVSGAQQALDILARLLWTPGDGALVETPGYTTAFDIFHLHEMSLHPIPVDDDGFDPAHIPSNCQARVAFVTPANQFPHGGTMSLSRRLALLDWARQCDALIIEDDYDGELRYGERPLAALQSLDQDGRVVYLGTFSKVLFPALRLGYVVLPPALVEPFVQAKSLLDRGAPTLTQAAVADFITEGHFERHLRHLRQSYGERRAVLVSALHAHLGDRVRFAPAAAGLHVMVYLPEECEETAVIHQAASVGVSISPGARYHLTTPAPPSLLLGFSGLTVDQIEEGVRKLSEVMTW